MLMDRPIPLHVTSPPAPPGDGRLLPTVAGAVVLLFIAALAAFVPGEDFVQALTGVSAKFRASEVGFGTIIGLLFGAAVATGYIAYLYVARRFWFYVVLIASFGCSEILILFLSYTSLALRYLCMLVLLVGALVSLISQRMRLSSVQYFALLWVTWIVVRALMSGMPAQALATLPIYVTIAFGVVVGLRGEFCRTDEVVRLGGAIALIGVVMTPIHLAAIWLAPAPFVEGRFSSFYFLPTAFANTYVLLVVGMLWYSFFGGRTVYRVATMVGVLVGCGLLAMSGTRNAAIVLAASYLFLALASARRWLYLGLLALFAFLAVLSDLLRQGGLMAAAFERLASFSFANREEVWGLAWQRILEHPFLGSGPSVSGGLLGAGVEEWEAATYINAHNAYIGTWLQFGLMGLLPLIAIYAISLRRGLWSCFSDTFSRSQKDAFALPASLVLALALAGMAEENLTSRGSLQQIIWALGVVAVNSAAVRRR